MSFSFLLKQKYDLLLLFVGSIVIFGLTYFASVVIENGDHTLSLLVSQAIIEHGTVQLDAYKDKVEQKHHFDYDYRIENINGHYYYLFPLVPSIFSVPVVWVANLLGQEMFIHEQEYVLLKGMAAISTALIFVIIYVICRCYLDKLPSLVIALISMLGSNLVSSLGIALSSMNFAVIFVLLSLLLLTLYDTGRIKAINPYLLGALLFFAFWSRPTTALFILVVFAYIFLRHRTIFLKLTLISLIPFLLFLGWTWLRYGQLLPYFYSPDRLIATPSFWEAFYGNAFSPARGLFIFSPFFALVVIGALWFFRDLKKRDLFWLSLVWFALFYVAIARKNEDWWDGHNFGSRVLTDGLPALILLTIFLWYTISQRISLATKTIALSSYVVLGAGAIFINSYQGLYNPSTYQWNKYPNIDRYPEYLFDWKYPQFLASEDSLRRRGLEHQQKQIGNYSLGNTITYDSRDAVFWDWYEPDEGWRWTQGVSPHIVFKLGSGVVDLEKRYMLEILGASIEAQDIGVALNDTKLGDLEMAAFSGEMPEIQSLTFDQALLNENDLNKIDFYIPKAASSGSGEDARTAGMAFVSLKIHPLSSQTEGVHYFDSEFFRGGFSNVEKGWRWTDGTVSEIIYPIDSVDEGKTYEMEIVSGASGRQQIEVLLNGRNLGALTFEGFEPEARVLTFSGTLLKMGDENKIRLLIPNATVPQGDSRRLGLAFISLKIYPLEQQ